MPQRGWTPQRERQYKHIKDSLRERGAAPDEAEEVAARTVNKERARAGESRRRSRSSTADISSERRGGLRSHRGPGGRTYAQLYAEARRRKVTGRSRYAEDYRVDGMLFTKLLTSRSARNNRGARNPACSANSASALPDGNRQLPASNHSTGIWGMLNFVKSRDAALRSSTLRVADPVGFWLLLMPVALPAFNFGQLGGFH